MTAIVVYMRDSLGAPEDNGVMAAGVGEEERVIAGRAVQYGASPLAYAAQSRSGDGAAADIADAGAGPGDGPEVGDAAECKADVGLQRRIAHQSVPAGTGAR